MDHSHMTCHLRKLSSTAINENNVSSEKAEGTVIKENPEGLTGLRCLCLTHFS